MIDDLSADAIRALRQRMGLTQAQLAKLLDAHPMTVSKWERTTERRRPTGAYAAALRRLLKANPPQ